MPAETRQQKHASRNTPAETRRNKNVPAETRKQKRLSHHTFLEPHTNTQYIISQIARSSQAECYLEPRPPRRHKHAINYKWLETTTSSQTESNRTSFELCVSISITPQPFQCSETPISIRTGSDIGSASGLAKASSRPGSSKLVWNSS